MALPTLRLRQPFAIQKLPSLTTFSAAVACAMMLQACTLKIATAQDEEGTPPPLLKGGIVHQLRSLSEGAKNAIDSGLSRNRSSNRSKVDPPPRVGGRTYRGSAGQDGNPQDVERLAMRQPPRPPAQPQERSIPHPTPGQKQPLAEVLRPEDLLGSATRPAASPRLRSAAAPQSSGNQVRGNQVHIETEIPEEVLRSIQSRTQAIQSQAPSQTTASDKPQKPRVSRIPLPGGQASQQTTAAKQKRATQSESAQTSNIAESPIASSQGSNLPPANEPPKVARRTPPSLPTQLPSAPIANSQGPSLDASTTLPAIPSLAGPNPLTDGSSLPPSQLAGSPTNAPGQTSPNLPGPNLPNPAALPTGIGASGEGSNSLTANSTASDSAELKLAGNPSKTADSQPVSVPVEPETKNALPALPPSAPMETAATQTPVTSPAKIATSSPTMQRPAMQRPTTNQPAKPQVDPNALRASSSSANTRMSMVTPKIHVVLDGPADIPVGRAAEYRIIVRNEDTIQLQGLLLQMDIPAGVIVQPAKPSQGALDLDKGEDGSTMISWTFERLPGSNQAVAPIMLTAAAPKNFPVAMEWTLLPLAELAHINVKAARLELALEGPSEVQFGKANTYRLHVRNPGNAIARDVEVALTAEQYGSSSSSIGDIGPGSEETIDVELTFNQRGAIEIAAAAQAGANLTADSKISVLVRKAELAAAIASPQLVYHGTPVPVKVTIRNTGDAKAENVVGTVRLPSGAKPVNLPPSARFENGEIRCTVGTIVAGASSDISFTARLQQQGANAFSLVCTDAADNLAKATSSTRVEAIADLVLLVSDPVAPAPVGAEVAYELTLTNRGSKAAKNVRVVAQFSNGIEPLRGEGPNFKIVPGQLFFDAIPSVEAGETIRLKVLANATEGGMHRFRAEVRTDEAQMRLVQEESTQYLDQISRTASLPGAGNIR